MVTYLGGSILITIFALGGSIVSYNLQISIILQLDITTCGEKTVSMTTLQQVVSNMFLKKIYIKIISHILSIKITYSRISDNNNFMY